MLAVPPPPPLPDAAAEDESTCRGVFVDFMTKVAQYEELAESGNRLLVRFRQELECFRRPPIPTESDVMNEILKSNCTGRMSLVLIFFLFLVPVRSCEDGLKDHINKVENVYGITLTASLSALKVPDSHSINNKLATESCIMEEEDKSADQLDSDVSFVSVMVIVGNMLKLDKTMQEKIVSALSLKTPSSELEGYCLMWDLRPYIDNSVMQLAWKMCPCP
ncbi:hypothetical protein BAE44_0005655 [Dichanthelium oligosanthes]|uniref:DUF7795 domain-containing protein n=1 Tax=Dichanthelium oligosanthes TaxID=888268 RepID=A0A1E5W7E0_9POAL|nr:hypothetical protein BAE44_0005655 [Dichanthelium oligosanthes]